MDSKTRAVALAAALPVVIKLSSEVGTAEVELALVEVLDGFGVDITAAVPSDVGAVRAARFRRPVSADLADVVVDRIAAEVRLGAAGMPAVAGVAPLVRALGRHDRACVQVGPVFVVKVGDSLVARKLDGDGFPFSGIGAAVGALEGC